MLMWKFLGAINQKRQKERNKQKKKQVHLTLQYPKQKKQVKKCLRQENCNYLLSPQLRAASCEVPSTKSQGDSVLHKRKKKKKTQFSAKFTLMFRFIATTPDTMSGANIPRNLRLLSSILRRLRVIFLSYFLHC